MTGRAYFIAGAHTDVGKTHVACALIRAARAGGLSVEALKPVVSGFDPADWSQSDPGRLLAALERPMTLAELARISPWRFRAPLAPPMAARRENQIFDFAPLVAYCRQRLAASRAELTLVEGVGGLMSPIAERATGLDLMVDLGLPTILVGGSYLGAISHTLTALEAMRAHGLVLTAVVLSQSADPDAPSLAETAAAVAERTGDVVVIAAPRGPDAAWISGLAAATGVRP